MQTRRRARQVLAALGGALTFELVWVGAGQAASAVLVANALAASERLSPGQAHILVKNLLASRGGPG